jgi:hypothetical protein
MALMLLAFAHSVIGIAMIYNCTVQSAEQLIVELLIKASSTLNRSLRSFDDFMS